MLSMPASSTAHEQVYRDLYDRIIRVEYEPDQCISAAEIAAEFHVSRTPVQNAFSRLASEGLINIFPQRGTYVSKIDLKKVYESVSIRILLDQIAIRAFCESEHDQALLELENNVNQQIFYLEKKNYDKVFQLDLDFHYCIYHFSGYDYSKAALDTISVDQQRFRQLKLSTNLRQLETVQEHIEIFNALRMGAADKAIYLDAMHITKFGSDIDNVYLQRPSYFLNWSKDLAKRFEVQQQMIYTLV